MDDEITEAELAIAAAQVKQLAAEAGRQATEAARWRATAELLSIENKKLREALNANPRTVLMDERDVDALRAEIERLRAALQTVVDLAEDGILPDGHDLEDFRTLLKPPAASRASSS
jgi:hypothetical protein